MNYDGSGIVPPYLADLANRTGMTLAEFARWVRSDEPCARCRHPKGHHIGAPPYDCHHGCDDENHGCTCPAFIAAVPDA